MTLDELNALDVAAAHRELLRCCGSSRWVAAVAARRPFASMDVLYRVADEVWWSLDGGDWLEAFSHHPRIGERAAAGSWARGEQSGMSQSSPQTARALAEGNRAYERRFGHVFLICATGKSADEMLENLRGRLTNDPATELRVAAKEQARITQLRLGRLLQPSPEASRRP